MLFIPPPLPPPPKKKEEGSNNDGLIHNNVSLSDRICTTSTPNAADRMVYADTHLYKSW